MKIPGWRKSSWEGVDLLDMIPRRVREGLLDPETGRVLVLIPRCSGPVLGRIMQPVLPAHKRQLKVPLEGKGSFLWEMIDGVRPIRSLVESFLAAYPEESSQAHERVCMYLVSMRENKFIEFINQPR